MRQGLLSAGIVVFSCAAFGQAAEHPRFEVESIRPNPDNWSERFEHPMGGGYQPGGRLIMNNASLLLLIQFAYALYDNPMSGHSAPLMASQVVGGPSWIN